MKESYFNVRPLGQGLIFLTRKGNSMGSDKQ
jgi:hypothetical protein